MESKFIFSRNCGLAILPIFVASFILIFESQSVRANECPHTNFMVIDGQCINLDPQMTTKKKTQITNPLSELNELTGSSIATYGSLLSLVGASAAGYKFLVRK
ncbi:hypothetical protein I4641_06015 [Waterburya agarophytonicola K14]|uniref:Uncharacterized protein n=1 Tax=Waterburya agarophytonicola KI4 TaxID=2874699 RepID=A0A964FGF2_9CYAN|nr:hypothetical protein [Waterburya agarophytonicola]MCC0176534.1 hypothetical protein [Waterburya agarophytonicola KI4]